jgi:hypothetical protein
VIIEAPGFNNSLAGGLNCPNSDKADYVTPVAAWYEKYLKDGMPLHQICRPTTKKSLSNCPIQ